MEEEAWVPYIWANSENCNELTNQQGTKELCQKNSGQERGSGVCQVAYSACVVGAQP